jgi:hypothetical protein
VRGATERVKDGVTRLERGRGSKRRREGSGNVTPQCHRRCRGRGQGRHRLKPRGAAAPFSRQRFRVRRRGAAPRDSRRQLQGRGRAEGCVRAGRCARGTREVDRAARTQRRRPASRHSKRQLQPRGVSARWRARALLSLLSATACCWIAAVRPPSAGSCARAHAEHAATVGLSFVGDG